MKRFVWGILVAGFLLFSVSPSIYELTQKNKLTGRTFEPVHNYVTDYHFYLSRIREGIDGRWTVVERYTHEAHKGSFIQIFYLLLGKPVSLIPDKAFAATLAYHAARIIFGLLLLYLISRVCRRVFSGTLWQVLAFLLVATASTIPIVVEVHGYPRFGGYMSWWTVMDSLQRITFIPHLLVGQSLIILLLFDLFGVGATSKRRALILKFIMAFILGMVFPPGLMFVAAVYGVESVIEFLSRPRSLLTSRAKRTKWFVDDILPRIAVVSGGVPTILYYSLMMTIPPWKRLIEFDALHPTWFPLPQYGYALGLTLAFGVLGLFVAIFRREKKMSILVSWVIAWASCIFLFRFIPQQSPLRFTEMVPQVPLGILSAYLLYIFYSRAEVGIAFFAHLSSNIISPKTPSGDKSCMSVLKKARLPARCMRFFSLTASIFTIVLGLGVMYSSFLWQKDFTDAKIAAGYPTVFMDNIMVHPVKGFTDALSYINTYTPEDAVILSDLTAGNYIPAYTGRRVFVGHDNTVNEERKLTDARAFFDGAMDSQEAQAWMFLTNITHVFFGPQEKKSGKNLSELYPFLRLAYTNSDVTVFTVPSAKTQ